ncbi:MAG: peptidylprolyl isomerase [Deltaproteobacteria bacterium]|nr:peptidylprolyl isomerase [Deltaproteobacteria bacterium]
MKNKINIIWKAILVLFVFFLVSGCGDKEKTKEVSPAPAVSESHASPNAPFVASEQSKPSDIVVSVDGKVLKKSELEQDINKIIKKFKDKIPADKQKEARINIKNQLVNTFVMKTLLANEIEKRKIGANDQEIKATKDRIQASLPPNKKLDEFFKENGISQEEIAFAVKVEKFKNQEIGDKAKPTQKEINKFYKDNQEKLFVEPESVHARHILVATKKEDNDKVKAQKKEKIENLRKQLLNGGDFAELARKNSDCPSKEVGGDLNFIKKGQMVKTLEDAAFSQKNNVIGPVITTEYGYHIIQVLDHKPAKKLSLDKVKGSISAHLEKQKTMQMFNDILKNLQQKAKIIVY